jgi:hypothetical protein
MKRLLVFPIKQEQHHSKVQVQRCHFWKISWGSSFQKYGMPITALAKMDP